MSVPIKGGEANKGTNAELNADLSAPWNPFCTHYLSPGVTAALSGSRFVGVAHDIDSNMETMLSPDSSTDSLHYD